MPTIAEVRPAAKTVIAESKDVMAHHDACTIAALINSGELSQAEVTEAAIARAAAVNPQLNAITHKAYEYGLKRASTALDGALAGVPTFIKDTDALVGHPCRIGSRATSDKPAGYSSDFVLQFEATGVVPIGISTPPEFGQSGTAEALLSSPTSNPRNTA